MGLGGLSSYVFENLGALGEILQDMVQSQLTR